MLDPSHGTGIANLVAPMCAACIAVGCDGLLVEVHTNPSQALSDGAQTITPAAFAGIMAAGARIAQLAGRELG
jgi:3-deoxy-7-phosphoheptulonate synthase